MKCHRGWVTRLLRISQVLDTCGNVSVGSSQWGPGIMSSCIWVGSRVIITLDVVNPLFGLLAVLKNFMSAKTFPHSILSSVCERACSSQRTFISSGVKAWMLSIRSLLLQSTTTGNNACIRGYQYTQKYQLSKERNDGRSDFAIRLGTQYFYYGNCGIVNIFMGWERCISIKL